MLPNAKVTETNKPPQILSVPTKHVLPSLVSEKRAFPLCEETQIKMQIHLSFPATSLRQDLSFCWKTELGCQAKAWKSLIYRQEFLFLYRKELLFLTTAGSFPKLHGILFQSKDQTYTWSFL